MSNPIVSIIMGSDSDLSVMKGSADILKEFKVSYEAHVLSAHRTPEKTVEYAKNAADKGIKVIIAGAGKAAHLPGVIAAYFPYPVIGVPIKTSDLGGLDSLYSIVQMPTGVPVATVAINGAKNAALLAIEILAVSDDNLKNKLRKHKNKMSEKSPKRTVLN